MELIFSPYGEFRWSPEGPVSQIHSPHLHADVPGIFSDLLRSVQMLKREWNAESNGNYRTYPFLVKLQPWFLSLQWKTCPWTEHSDDDYYTTMAPKFLYGRKICDLAEVRTPLVTHTLLYSRKWLRSPRKTLKNPPVFSYLCDCHYLSEPKYFHCNHFHSFISDNL